MAAVHTGTPRPRLPTPSPPREIGRRGEEIAAAHLQRLGFALLERNLRTREGEIDLIAFDGTTLVFAEVKTRTGRRRGGRAQLSDPGPLDRLLPAQRMRLRRLALAWLAGRAGRRPSASTIRFDAIGVTVDRGGRLVRLDHLEGAW